MKKLLFAAAACTMAFAAPAAADHHSESETRAALEAAVAADWRGEDRERDQYRHPVETIEFFQIKPGMTVVDYVPPPGWYTKILVPYLGSKGTYVATIRTFEGGSPEGQARQRVFPEVFPRLTREDMEKNSIENAAKIEGLNTIYIPEEMHGTADRVLVFRMMHNLHRWGLVPEELSNFRKLLKNDGMLGIVQHRARADAPYSYADGNNGYMRQEDVIKLVEAHGFELVASSEINANPKDTADHEGGVWQIPPRWASQDEAKKAIGESDRMTLLFKKRP
ncbi:hypothetical protein P7228_04335 [Altererythrobacter arenosus]|uniref:Methyltransferase n=1 Tax=Altererythrobacter arenosus TaxID=3032592 RepID=A0ABY8FTG4_9SPHN|nr:hypothetical protein [Altererythrobacter sp. CAU 1644]WFL78299.1 hypothetical protein P7228_04335 [Altererythrobacter sp. CAU 1644]